MSSTDWDLNLLESLIVDRGDKVVVETGMACPACRNEDPLAVNVTLDNRPAYIRSMYCPACFGNGYIYRNTRIVNGLVTATRPGDHKLTEVGYDSSGECVFSPSLSADFIGAGDRIIFTNPSDVDKGQLIIRGIANAGDNVNYKTDLNTNEDRLWYMADSVQWCEDSNGVVYYPGADFKTEGNRILWINSPEIGTTYVVKYRAYLEWLVTFSPMERFDRGRNLAQKVSLKRKHVVLLQNTANLFNNLKNLNKASTITYSAPAVSINSRAISMDGSVAISMDGSVAVPAIS